MRLKKVNVISTAGYIIIKNTAHDETGLLSEVIYTPNHAIRVPRRYAPASPKKIIPNIFKIKKPKQHTDKR